MDLKEANDWAVPLTGADPDVCDEDGGPSNRDLLYYTRPLPGRLYAAFCRDHRPSAERLRALSQDRLKATSAAAP